MTDQRVITLAEHKTEVFEAIPATTADRELAEQPEIRNRLALRWLAGDRLEVSTTSHVGVITLDSVVVRITPKLVGGELGVLHMLDYTSGTSTLHTLPAPRSMPTGGLHLRDLLCLLLATECEGILRSGPRRDYTRREDLLPALRGRLLTDRQLLRRHGRLDHLECRFDEFTTDILDNRLCAVALGVAARTASDTAVRARARVVAADFAALCATPPLDAGHVATVLSYHRHNEHYRAAHHWALLLLGAGGFDDLYTSSRHHGEAFLLDMNRLFERFATRLLREAAAGTGLVVLDQVAHSGIIRDETAGRTYTNLIPDIVISDGRSPHAWRRPVDIKYKMYADRKLDPTDLYQTFLYGYALSRDDAPTACILYPGPASTPTTTLTIRHPDNSVGAHVNAMPIDVPLYLNTNDPTRRRDLLETLLGQLTSNMRAPA
ncbi:McrC family protein [Kutzneria sp. CA-103260]|uniref:McrC family protein n=1 Tax=Kutzneria sp. CA-103260 TaxID=2802641 RepID=UPI001BA856C6|nr:hypothetical protein [Kutzneria sp. CA-103260]QUQ68286.1 McrBC 5-methylcytosine restriction system component [Kutzneria sp. CA-103260]